MGMDRWTNAWRWGFAATYKVSKEKKNNFTFKDFFIEILRLPIITKKIKTVNFDLTSEILKA